jgi:hypothetical protein
MAKETGVDPDVEDATRAGDMAMLFYSIGMCPVEAPTWIWFSCDDSQLTSSSLDRSCRRCGNSPPVLKPA